MTKALSRMQPESHLFDSKGRLRFQPLDLKSDENGEKGVVVLKCKHKLNNEEIKYLEVFAPSDLPEIMNSEQVGKLSAFEQSCLFATRMFANVDAQGRVKFGDGLKDYLGATKGVVTVPIIRKCESGDVKGIAIWSEKDYLKHIDPTFAVKTR